MSETRVAPILVSACLLGRECRHNAVVRRNEELLELPAGSILPVCPEVLGGLPTPRAPADLEGGDGADVLDGRAAVVDAAGNEVTRNFLEGAFRALDQARAAGARRAILKSRSPSCGCGELSRGDGTTRPGNGVFAELLLRSGFEVDTRDFTEQASP